MINEEIARDIYRETCLSPFEPVAGGAAEIAERLDLATYEQPDARAEATLATWGGTSRIVLQHGLQPERANFLIAQMVARAFSSAKLSTDDEFSVAAWLVAPPYSFRARYHQVGTDLAALARPFSITHTTAALRLNEVIGTDLVIVCKNRPPIRRSRRLLGQLDDEELAGLAAKRSTKSVRKVRLRADGAAVALMAG